MRHGSLFSGIGGFDLAAQWMGWDNTFHCEWNEFCQKVLKYHFPKSISYGDITKTDFTIWRGKIDILTGGFPCQPYSMAGKRKGKEDERHLWPEMLRTIREIQPSWVVGENVPGIINWSGGLVFHEVQTDLETEGYEVLPVVLPACGVNAPHRRYRVWFIAYRDSIRYSGRKFNENGQQYEKRRKAWSEFTSLKLCRTSPDTENKNDKLSVRTKKEYTKSGINEDNEITPNTKSERLEGENRFRMERTKQSSESNATYTDSNKRSQRGMHTPESKETERHTGTRNARTIQCQTWDNFPTQSPLCSRNDGISSRLDGITFSKWRNESIKAYGNAIVPQIALMIFRAIADYENI